MKASTENASYLMATTAPVQVDDPHIDDRVGTRPASDQRSTCDVRGGAQAAEGGVGGVVDGQGGRSEQGGSSTSAQEVELRQFGASASSPREIESSGTSQRRSSALAKQPQSRPAIVKLEKEIEDLRNKIQQVEAAKEEAEKKTSVEVEVADLVKEKKKLTDKFEKFSFEDRLDVYIVKLKEEITKPEPDGSSTAVYSEELEGETSQEPFAKQLKSVEEAEAESLKKLLLKELKKRIEKASTTRWTPCGKTKRSKSDIENKLTPKLPETYLEIKRLLWVEGQKVHKKALEVWQNKEVLFTKRVERKKSKVAELKNEVYQLIGFFSVFQGVVLTAVAQASQLHCPTRWIPISLSILASVVTIAGVIQKLDQISAFQKTVHSEEQSLKVCPLFSATMFTTKF